MRKDPSAELEQLAAQKLQRRLRPLESATGPEIRREGISLHNFASNDYLGLANHPRICEAFIEGIQQYGAGSGASRLVCGSLPSHTALEEEVASAKGTEAALVFSSGFAISVGCLPAIVGRGDIVILDKLCHASLIDGARLSGATVRVFPHNEMEALGRLLTKLRAADSNNRILIVTESVFSMDGDLCPLREIVELAEAHDALLFLDEAHGFGVLGPTGMGLAEAEGLSDRVTFQMGTFSKAAGLSGGYIAASQAWIDLLVNRARSFIYSTAPPPALANATRRSLEVIRSEEGGVLRKRLFENIGIISKNAESAIVPFIMGTNEATLGASQKLENEGFLVPAIRYPTVPRGKARLRVSISAAHSPTMVSELAGLLVKQCQTLR